MNEAWFMFFDFRFSMLYELLFMMLFLRLRYSIRKSILYALICFTVTNYFDAGVFLFAWSRPLCSVIQIVLTLATTLLLSKERDWRAIFTSVTASMYVLTGNIASMMALLAVGYEAALLIGFVVRGVTFWFFAAKLRKFYLKVQTSMEHGWAQLCIIPSFYYVIVYALLYWPSSAVLIPTNYVAATLVIAQAVYSYRLIFRLVVQQTREIELKRSNDSLMLCAKSIRDEAETFRLAQQKTAILRHDMRHFLNVMRTYVDAGETEQLRKAIDDVDQSITESRPVQYCENVAVNGVIAHFAELAEQKQIKIRCRAEIPFQLRMNEFELAAVVSNLLENAVRAASRLEPAADKTIVIGASCTKTQMLLEISNVCTENVRFSEETGLPLTTEGEGHGYGMQSVLAFSQKNHAALDCSLEKGRFVTRLLIPLCPKAGA